MRAGRLCQAVAHVRQRGKAKAVGCLWWIAVEQSGFPRDAGERCPAVSMDPGLVGEETPDRVVFVVVQAGGGDLDLSAGDDRHPLGVVGELAVNSLPEGVCCGRVSLPRCVARPRPRRSSSPRPRLLRRQGGTLVEAAALGRIQQRRVPDPRRRGSRSTTARSPASPASAV
jgi:hypothetical protein